LVNYEVRVVLRAWYREDELEEPKGVSKVKALTNKTRNALGLFYEVFDN